MTYCLGMLCRKGAVFLSDSRTSAGMDNITVRTKMRVFEKPGDRVICILSSGNLSLTQATMALIDDDLHLNESHPARSHLLNRPTFYETVRYVGSKVREVEQRDRAALEADGFDFNINLIVGGQIAGLAPRCIRFIRKATASMRAGIARSCRSATRNTANQFSIAVSATTAR